MYRKNVSGMLLLAAFVVVVAAALVLSGCSTKSKLSDSGGTVAGEAITVSASPNTISTSVTSVVEALMLSDGSPVVGEEIHFSISPSSSGEISPEIDTTDANGVAATLFTPSGVGSITITAMTADGVVEGSTTINISAEETQNGTGYVWLSVLPTSLLTGVQDTANVRIEVRDSLQAIPATGTEVVIVAGEDFVDNDGDGYFTAGTDQLTGDSNGNGWWDAFGTIDSVAATDATGLITLNYVATSATSRSVVIRATVRDSGFTGYDKETVTFAPMGTIHSVYLTSDTLQLSVTQTGGIETAYLRAVAYDLYGEPVGSGLPIYFQILDGPGGGEHLYNQATGEGPYMVETDENGVATVPLTAGTISGTVRVRAYSGSALSAATQILIAAGPPYRIFIAADTCNVAAWTRVNVENPLVAIVSDVYNNPVNDSTVVYWSCDEGVVKASEGRTIEHEGRVKTFWMSTGAPADGDGLVVYWAETAGGTVADTQFFFDSYTPDTIMASGVPDSLTLNGKDEATFLISSIDFHALPVVDGTEYETHANFVGVANGSFQDGCASAWDRVTVTSTTLDYDYSTTGGNDDGIGAIDWITIYAGLGAKSEYPVTLYTGEAYKGNCSITGDASATGVETLEFSVTIKDRWGNPLADHTCNMTASVGSVANGSQETDQYGEANGFRWTSVSDTEEYEATITITDTDPRGGIVLSTKVKVSP